jgi:hypothetical protein
VGISRERQLGAQSCLVELLARLEEKGIGREEGRRRHAQQRGGGGHQQHIALASADFMQSGESLRHQVMVRGKGVVGQRFPIRQEMAAQRGFSAGGKPADFVQQPLRVRWI